MTIKNMRVKLLAASVATLLLSGYAHASGYESEMVILHPFQWHYNSIAKECTEYLGPAGFDGVQISQPAEHINKTDAWWAVYQPVNFKNFTTMTGNEQELRAMLKACNEAGVKVFADAVINKKDIINAVTGNNSFIQVYSLTGKDNKRYMETFTKDNLQELEYLLCTPCNLELRTYFPTPKYYNKTQMFMAEIGLDRPISKPDFDNVEKPYADMFTDNIWIDDIIVVDATIRKFYSILPRVEIILQYQNHLYNKHQHDSMLKRKNYTEGMNINYFGGINNGNNQ